jgi:hypothetical protein
VPVVHHKQAARGERKDHDAARRSDSEDFSRLVLDRDRTIGRHECVILSQERAPTLLDQPFGDSHGFGSNESIPFVVEIR